jgi:diguanylate cyclase (GGDEF)-like protein
MVNPTSFSHKLSMAFAAVVLVVTMTIPVAIHAFLSVRQTSREASQASVTLERVIDLQRQVQHLQADARAYAAGRGSVGAVVRDVDSVTAVAKRIHGEVPETERTKWERIWESASQAEQLLENGVRTGNRADGLERFNAAIERDVLAPAQNFAKHDLRDRRLVASQRIDSRIKQSAALLLLVLGASLALASLLAYWIPRRLMQRVNHLGSVAHRLAGGDLTTRAQHNGVGSDEIADLINDFNVMARAMEQRENDFRRIEAELNQRIYDETQRATRDPLTQLHNHRYFQEALQAELERCARTGGNVTIAVLDLDNFKQVNDRFGHQEGDEVLLRVSHGIVESLRPYDLACRLGGEEFGVIFPETAPQEAHVVMSRIADLVRPYGPQGEQATFSAGLACFPQHAKVQSELFQRADEAAYTAKSKGKDQTVVYSVTDVVAMDSEDRIKQRSRDALLTTAKTLVHAVDAKDPYTAQHSERTAAYATTLARSLGLEDETVKLVHQAALLHDVGKIGISDSILRKPSRLTDDEYEQIKQHPAFSHRIVENAEVEVIAQWVLHHHEHWDGSGYPTGLAGEEIPLGSRIILVCDAFEAMTNDRVYRQALTVDQALSELMRNAGRQFDPHLVEIMVHLVQNGMVVPAAPTSPGGLVLPTAGSLVPPSEPTQPQPYVPIDDEPPIGLPRFDDSDAA